MTACQLQCGGRLCRACQHSVGPCIFPFLQPNGFYASHTCSLHRISDRAVRNGCILCNSRVIVWRQAILEKCPLGHPVCECFVFRTERVQYAILHLEGPILPMPLPDCRTRVQAAAGVATGRCSTQSSSSPRLAAPYTT